MSHFSRRKFLQSSIILSAGIPLLKPWARAAGKEPIRPEKLFMLFKNPPVTAKPFVRWWWNGDKLSEKEILRELDVMKAAGIGGVEINPIAFPGGDDLGIRSLTWLSPEWIDMVKVALKGAEQRGMICDIIVGSGWPFGGEFLEKEERSQLLTISTKKVQGAQRITVNIPEMLEEATPVIHSKYSGQTKELYSLQLAPVKMSRFTPATTIPVDKNKEVVTFDVPEGEHILYALVKFYGFQAVINGAPGAAGPVLNHYSKEAVEKFLNHMSDNLFPAIKELKGFRAMFCDSMELEGANWCHDFLSEFKRRRGYEVEPYLPYILYKVGHMGRPVEGLAITEVTGEAKEEIERVRYDFFVVCMELMHDRFLVTYKNWCHQNKVKSRMQPYGREFHPLEASFDIDIPECETWLWFGDSKKEMDWAKRPAYTNVNKFVASAARLSGKRLVSCEEVTNTDVVFNASLERVKVVGDQSNLSGVTHSILHGFNYTPLEAPFPGWIRYGMFFNERNTWWPWFSRWSAYKARLSSLLQETDSFADIAVMHPLADMWTKLGPQRDPFPEILYPEYQYKVWGAIHQNGNSCDYTSERVIQNSKVENGSLNYNGRKYHTLIFIEVETMMPETAKALVSFVESGGKLLFIEKEPHKSAGLVNYRKRDQEVKQAISSIKQQYPQRVFNVPAPAGDMLVWFKNIQRLCDIQPYVKIDNPSPFVSQIRHQLDNKDLYFFSNYDMNNPISMKCTFPETKKKAWIWNAETGERYHCPTASGNVLNLTFEPSESKIIVFDNYGGDEMSASMPVERVNGEELRDWNVRMQHMNGSVVNVNIVTMKDWSTDESTRGFAGDLIYEKEIASIPPSCNYIDLGKVYGISEVSINGESLGSKWYGRHFYQIPEKYLKSKNLTLRVKIVTTVGNYLKASPDNRIGQNWTHHQDWQPMGMLGPVRFL